MNGRSEEYSLFVKYVDGEPTEYLYGPSWKSMELMVDGGYPTKEAAIEAWSKEQESESKQFGN